MSDLEEILELVDSLEEESASQALENFDLSVFENSTISDNSEILNLETSCTKVELLSFRLRQVEERLGFFYLAFWKAKQESAVNILTSICRNRFKWEVSFEDFKIVKPLDCKRAGFLLQVSSIIWRDKILSNKQQFLLEGFHVAYECNFIFNYLFI